MAQTVIGTLIIDIKSKFDSTNFDKGEARAERFGKNVRSSLAKAFSVAAIGTFFTSSVKAWGEQEQAIAKVRAGLESTRAVAGQTLDGLIEGAQKLSRTSLFGDEQILAELTANLLTFTNVTEGTFDRASQAIVDVTAKLSDAGFASASLQSTTIALGKALNDPIANMGALSRMGIQFSDSQKEVIERLAETGRLAEAQAVILAELENQYGGTAAAVAAAGTGPLKQAANVWGDITEAIGEALADAILPVIKGLKSMLEWVDSLPRPLEKLVTTLGATGAAAAALAFAFGPIGAAVAGVVGAVTLLLPLFKTKAERLEDIRLASNKAKNAIMGLGRAELELAQAELLEQQVAESSILTQIRKTITLGRAAAQRSRDSRTTAAILQEVTKAETELSETRERLAGTSSQLRLVQDRLRESLAKLDGPTTNIAKTTKEQKEAAKKYAEALKDTDKAAKGFIRTTRPLAELTAEQVAQYKQAEASLRHEENALVDLVFAIDPATEGLKELTKEQLALLDAFKPDKVSFLDGFTDSLGDRLFLAADLVRDFTGTVQGLLSAAGPWGMALAGALELLKAFGVDFNKILSEVGEAIGDVLGIGGGASFGEQLAALTIGELQDVLNDLAGALGASFNGINISDMFSETLQTIIDKVGAGLSEIERLAAAHAAIGREYDKEAEKLAFLETIFIELGTTLPLTSDFMLILKGMIDRLRGAAADGGAALEEATIKFGVFISAVQDAVEAIAGTTVEPILGGLQETSPIIFLMADINAEIERMRLIAETLNVPFDEAQALSDLLAQNITRLINEGYRPGNAVLDQLIDRYTKLNAEMGRQVDIASMFVKETLADFSQAIAGLDRVFELTGDAAETYRDKLSEAERAQRALEDAIAAGTISVEEAEGAWMFLQGRIDEFKRLLDALADGPPIPPPGSGGGGTTGDATGTIRDGQITLHFPDSFHLVGDGLTTLTEMRDLLRTANAALALLVFTEGDISSRLRAFSGAVQAVGFGDPFGRIISDGSPRSGRERVLILDRTMEEITAATLEGLG